jgi:hypothetical protein
MAPNCQQTITKPGQICTASATHLHEQLQEPIPGSSGTPQLTFESLPFVFVLSQLGSLFRLTESFIQVSMLFHVSHVKPATLLPLTQTVVVFGKPYGIHLFQNGLNDTVTSLLIFGTGKNLQKRSAQHHGIQADHHPHAASAGRAGEHFAPHCI